MYMLFRSVLADPWSKRHTRLSGIIADSSIAIAGTRGRLMVAPLSPATLACLSVRLRPSKGSDPGKSPTQGGCAWSLEA